MENCGHRDYCACPAFGDTRIGTYVFVGASILKDAVNRIGDLIDDGKENGSLKD